MVSWHGDFTGLPQVAYFVVERNRRVPRQGTLLRRCQAAHFDQGLEPLSRWASGGPVYPTPPGRGQERAGKRLTRACGCSAAAPVLRTVRLSVDQAATRPFVFCRASWGGFGRLKPPGVATINVDAYARFVRRHAVYRARLSPRSSRSSGPSGPPLLERGSRQEPSAA